MPDLTASVFREVVVGVAEQPPLTKFRRRNYRMTGRPRVLGRVLVRRIITAQCDAAFLTGAQMNPPSADLDALCAFSALGLLDISDRSDVSARAIRSHDE